MGDPLTPVERAAGDAVEEIIDDLRSRSGLRHVWDGIDHVTLREIRIAWSTIVERAMIGVVKS
jgi:hypothetical protein